MTIPEFSELQTKGITVIGSNVLWEADEVTKCDLDNSIEIHVPSEEFHIDEKNEVADIIYEYVSDAITNMTDYCHEGFDLNID